MTNWGTPARTIRIEAELWAAVKAKAAQEDTTASEAIRALLKEWIEKPMKHKITTMERGKSGDQGQHKGYAASCTCGAVTFGGFVTRTEARAALEHEAAVLAIGDDGEVVAYSPRATIRVEYKEAGKE